MSLRNDEDYDDDGHHEAFHHQQHPRGYGNYYRYDDSDDFDTGTSDSEFFSRSDDEGRYDSPTETTDMEIRRRHQPRNYKLGDTSSSSDDEDGRPRAPPTQNVFEHQASPRMMRGGGDSINSPTSPPMFLRHSMPSLTRPLDPAVRSSFTAQDLAVESEQEGHDADVEPSDLDPMYSGHEETDDERKQGTGIASTKGNDRGSKPPAPPKYNVFDHNTSSSRIGREHMSPLILTRTRPLDSVFKAKIGSFPLLTDNEIPDRKTSQSPSEIKVFDPSSAASSSSVESPIQKRRHTVTLPNKKGTREIEPSSIASVSPPVAGIGEIPSRSSYVADSESRLQYRASDIVELDMEGHQEQESGVVRIQENCAADDYLQADATASIGDNVGVSSGGVANEEAQEAGGLSEYDQVAEVKDSNPDTPVVVDRTEFQATDFDGSDVLEMPMEEQATPEIDAEVVDDVVGMTENSFTGLDEIDSQGNLTEEPSDLGHQLSVEALDEDLVVERVHASNSADEEAVTPPRSNKKNSRFEILSDEKNPLTDIKKLQDRAMRRRRDMQIRMHDLECQLASVTSMHAEEKMDLDLALRDTLDRCVREPLEESAERLTMERESSTLGPNIAELGNRLNNLDNRMTHHLFVELQNAKREKLESLHDTLYQDTIPAFRIENSTSDKIEGGIVRRYEQLAGVIARQYHQECASRRAAMEEIKKKIDIVAHQDQRRLEGTLATIEDLREQLRRERANRIAADTKIKNEIARTTAAMKRALLAAVGVGS